MVAHGGTSVAGSFIQTLTMVDVATSWTECMPLVTRESGLVVRAMERAQSLFPWLIRGADFDNDSAFMNDVVVPWCRAQKIEVTRSRAYKKNDQAFVEQKNGAVVRRLVGYGRFDGGETTRVLERLYAASRLHTNFFQPSFKLKYKRREGAKVIKRYHVPATPYERALAHPKLSKAVKRRLREIYRTLDPVALLAEMRDAQAELGTRVGTRAGKLAAAASLPAPTTNAAAFAKSLGNDVHLGEQRIIHRRMHKPYKTRVRMPSILDPYRADIERWLAAEPRLTALAILGRLAEHSPEKFGPPQHTIVQRLLRSLRRNAAEVIIPRMAGGTAPAAIGDPATAGGAACDGHSAAPPVPPILRAMTQPPADSRDYIRQAKVTSSGEAIRGVNLRSRDTLIGSIRRECLDHIIVLGEVHLRRVLQSYADYYNGVRTHRSLNKDAPVSRPVQRTGVRSRAILADCITATPVVKFSVHTPALGLGRSPDLAPPGAEAIPMELKATQMRPLQVLL
jgi:hypothetical protein